MKSRTHIVNDPNEVSFLDFPQDIRRAIPSVAPENEAINMKRKLLMSCKTLQGFFQADLDERDAQSLLSYVLQGNAQEAKKIYDANPRLLFIEATAKEYAKGLDKNGMIVHRVVTESPFKAAARAGDTLMLKDMKEQFGKVFDKRSEKSGETLAKEQLAEIFPHGFEYPASRYDFSKLVDAITNDQILINANDFVEPGKASSNTEEALARFRDFMSASEKVGYHFNLNELIKACEVYNNNYEQWNRYQSGIFWSQVVGYLERLVSACDAQALCQGIENVLDGKPLKRSFDLDLYVNGEKKKISYFPLDVDPSRYLGGSFAVGSYYADGRGGACRRFWLVVVADLKKYVNQKQQDLENLSNSCTNQPII